MKKTTIALIAILVVAAIGGAFYGGTKVGEQRARQNMLTTFQSGGRVMGGQFPGGGGQFPGARGTPEARQGRTLVFGGGTVGTIESIEGNIVTISTDDATIRVQTSDTTLIEKTMPVQVTDLEVGEQVLVSGSENADGSLNARSISSMRRMQDMQALPSGQ